MNVFFDVFDFSVKEIVDFMVVLGVFLYKCVFIEKGFFVGYVVVLFLVMFFFNFD